MRTKGGIQKDLLKELSNLCKKADVKFILLGRAAVMARNGELIDDNGIPNLEIAMCQGDAERLPKLLKNKEYYFEYSLNNPKFDKHHMMFGYKNSIDVELKEFNFEKSSHIKNNCIRITIHYIEHTNFSKKKSKQLQLKRRLWKVKNLDYKFKSNPLLWATGNTLRSFYNLGGVSRSNQKRYLEKKNAYAISSFKDIKKNEMVRIQGLKNIDSNFFAKLKEIKFENVNCFLPEKFEEFALNLYGENWENCGKGISNRITSANFSYEEFVKDNTNKEKIDLIATLTEEVYISSLRTRRYKKKMKEFRQQIKQSERVVQCRVEYIRRKKEILILHKEKKYEELLEAFDVLISAMKKGIKLGYTFSVDNEIDNVLDETLRFCGEEKLADKILTYRIEI